jgi:hypothetical protein
VQGSSITLYPGDPKGKKEVPESPKVEAPKVELEYVAKPFNKERKERLKENLKVMGCEKLLDLYWGYMSDETVKEIVSKTSANQFKSTVQAAPEQWTEAKVAAGFLVSDKGKGLSPRGSRGILTWQ